MLSIARNPSAIRPDAEPLFREQWWVVLEVLRLKAGENGLGPRIVDSRDERVVPYLSRRLGFRACRVNGRRAVLLASAGTMAPARSMATHPGGSGRRACAFVRL